MGSPESTPDDKVAPTDSRESILIHMAPPGVEHLTPPTGPPPEPPSTLDESHQDEDVSPGEVAARLGLGLLGVGAALGGAYLAPQPAMVVQEQTQETTQAIDDQISETISRIVLAVGAAYAAPLGKIVIDIIVKKAAESVYAEAEGKLKATWERILGRNKPATPDTEPGPVPDVLEAATMLIESSASGRPNGIMMANFTLTAKKHGLTDESILKFLQAIEKTASETGEPHVGAS